MLQHELTYQTSLEDIFAVLQFEWELEKGANSFFHIFFYNVYTFLKF